MPIFVRLILVCGALFAWIGTFLALQPIVLAHRRIVITLWFDTHSLTVAFALFIVVFCATGWILARHGKSATFSIAIVVFGLAMLIASIEILLLGNPTSEADRAAWWGRNRGFLRAGRLWLESFGLLGLGTGGAWFAVRIWRMPQPARYAWRAAGIVYIAASAVFVAAAFAFFAISAQDEFFDRVYWDWDLRRRLVETFVATRWLGPALACLAISIHGIALILTPPTAKQPQSKRGSGVDDD